MRETPLNSRTVLEIPATLERYRSSSSGSHYKRKVAAYARVSTDSDEQFSSYEAQIDYYTRFIKQRDDWVFVDMYSDEGISGVQTKNRTGFNQMIKDALDGKIDLIVTKSVSRFARNTVDSLVTIRKLKEHGVEVFFEKENIWTLDSSGELLLTIMSSVAQEESRSISENVTWGQRKRFADGKVSVAYKRFLGYDKGPNGAMVINEEEAKIVRLVFRLFMLGMTPNGIAEYLEARGIPTVTGKFHWNAATILSILTNEKYKGDALLQKRFTVDFLTKKMKVNEGEVPQYYVKNSHPFIIPPIEFDVVQAEIARRKELGRSYSGKGPFYSKLFCGDCGNLYGLKVWHSNDKYRRVVWRCNAKFKDGETKCETPAVSPETIQRLFVKAYNEVIVNRERLIEDCELMIASITEMPELEESIANINDELQVIAGLINACVQENAIVAQSQVEYSQKYDVLIARYEHGADKLRRLKDEQAFLARKHCELYYFVSELREQDLLLKDWDETAWVIMLERAIVTREGKVVFEFRNGLKLTLSIA